MSAKHRFWLTHAIGPLLVFAAAASVCALTSIDFSIAHAVFFDEAQMRWIGRGVWLVNAVLHTGGRWFIAAVATAALGLTFVNHSRRQLRAPAGYVASTMLLSVAVVALLKRSTNVDCPWDLQEFGGSRPFTLLLGDRPDWLPPARCFRRLMRAPGTP
ncbi:MAG TPA: hypothetical protein VHK24_05060 [Steroidobacter sp.]|nr:hypothetical protein [Steroidobacter sp.]